MKRFAFLLMLIICVTSAKAQFVPMSSTFSTPMGPIHTTHYVYMPYNYGRGSYNPKFKLTAVLMNDSTVSFKSKMLVENKKMYVEYKENGTKHKYFPSDTKSIMGITDIGTTVGGIPADSCWLFLAKVGPIKGYSSVPSTQLSSVIAVQKGNEGVILSLTKDHLRELVSDMTDEKLTKWLDKGHLTKVIERYNDLKTGIKKK